MLVHRIEKRQFYGIPFTFISNFYNYYQPLDVLLVVSCVEIFILWVLWMYFILWVIWMYFILWVLRMYFVF